LVYNKFFKDEHYRLLKYSIENDLYPKVGNYFSEASYVIVASESLINKDFEWAEKFIEEFKHKLKSEVRENAYTFCMANLNYRKGNYEKALKFLVKVSIEDIYYQLKVKNLQIKIHYELGNYEMCKSVIDSFRHFLGSVKQFPEFVRIRFVNYVNFTSRMVNVWLGGDPRNMIEINREIEEISQDKVESKSWLLAQAAKIKY
jgi:tetratricopeptide (TPR) repeat protein